jgi:hypothetical protein
LCVSDEKYLQTIWDDITSEFKDIPYLNLTQDTIWTVTDGYGRTEYRSSHPWAIRPGPSVFWNTKGCPTFDRYLIRVKSTNENQYASLRGVISTVIQHQVWKVEQIIFITVVRSVDKEDLSKNLKFFRVPEPSINSIYSKLAMRTFDVYANILKCMYITGFSGGATRSETSSDSQPTPFVVTSLTHTVDTLPKPDNFKRRKKESPELKDK